ncbi:MAG: hypothetical protein KME29_29395 [Calothrix sp. FI2-JRJ7]|jgi:tetratricopeptide (TPR) repeat protein|nr:hypothetical protein [Calothrix sp. FI2-JRJ7]
MLPIRVQSFLILLAVSAPLSVFSVEPHNISQAVAQTSSDSNNQADKLIKQGEKLRDTNQLQAALKKFEEALSIARKNKDKAFEGKALNNIGNIYADLNQA